MKLSYVVLEEDTPEAIAAAKESLGVEKAEKKTANSTKNDVTESVTILRPLTVSVEELGLSDADALAIHNDQTYRKALGLAVDKHPKEGGSGKGRKSDIV